MNRKIKTFAALIFAASMLLQSCGIVQFRRSDGTAITDATDKTETTIETETSTGSAGDGTGGDVATDTSAQSDRTETGAETALAPETQAPNTAAPTASGVTTPQHKDGVISFLAAGDNIIHEAIYTDAKNRAGGNGYNFLPMYDGIAPFVSSFDLAFVNQETPLAGESYGYSGYPNFNSPREAMEALEKVGFDIVNIANNHMLDMRTSGLKSTIEYMRTRPVTTIGAYENSALIDDVPTVTKDGITIAFLAYTYGTNDMQLDTSYGITVPLFDEELITRQMKAAKEKADLVFVSCHWGIEDSFEPSAEQKRYAQLLCDLGADVIIGQHPHVIQPITKLTGTGGNETLVIYSLGNMISTMLYGRNMVGGFVTFDIVTHSDGSKPGIENVRFVPTVTHYSKTRDSLQVYLLADYTEELAAAHGCKKNSSDFSHERAWKYVTDTIDPVYLS